VSRVNADRIEANLAPTASKTGPYCDARDRIPEAYLHELAAGAGAEMEAATPEQWLWRGRHVKVVDGSSFTMADTVENQGEYPQVATQAPGAGFPIARFVAVMSLALGTVLDAAIAPYQGKLTGEHALLRQLLHCLNVGDVVLGDAYYGSYFLIATLLAGGVDCVFQMNGCRDVDFRRGKRLGRRDHLVSWLKPKRPSWMTVEEYAQFPKTIEVRESEFIVDVVGCRSSNIIVVSTLLNEKKYTISDLSALYRRRWVAEINLRTLKTTMKMEYIRCQSPEMVRKDFWAHILAYNLIRKLMAQAALGAGRQPWEISFKGAVQNLAAFRNLWLFSNIDPAKVMRHLLNAISQQIVGHRPNRHEPRAQKRRPKQYPFLTVRRALM
jgi:hypothetical protein